MTWCFMHDRDRQTIEVNNCMYAWMDELERERERERESESERER